MKIFSVWVLIALMVFGTLSGAYHFLLARNPRKVLVVVDSSFSMRAVWHLVPGKVKTLSGRRYTEFGLVTEKIRIHKWSPELRLGSVSPYAPRNFANLEDGDYFPEIGEANEIYLITSAPEALTRGFGGWEIIRPSR